jgi:hypothetical protein
MMPGIRRAGPQVDVLVELAPEQQQRLPQRGVVGDLLGPADGAEEDGIVAADLVLPVVRHVLAVLLAVVPAREIEVVELQVDAEFRRRRLHHPHALGHGFLADAVAGDDCDALPAHGVLLKNCSASASRAWALLPQCNARTAGASLDRGGPLAPERKHVEVAADRAVLAPQHAQRLAELAAAATSARSCARSMPAEAR